MASQQIEKVCIQGCNLRGNDPTASRDLARFLCLLPCLTDLTIKDSDDQYSHLFLRDDFYHELARQASSSKIEKVCIQGCNLHENDQRASRDLARFLCLLPCLTDLTIKDSDDQYSHLFLRDDFYHELARQASSSKIEKLYIDCYLKKNDRMVSCDLANFLCFLPCLTNLTVKDDSKLLLHDDFYLELALLASSSKNPFFSNLLTRTTGTARLSTTLAIFTPSTAISVTWRCSDSTFITNDQPTSRNDTNNPACPPISYVRNIPATSHHLPSQPATSNTRSASPAIFTDTCLTDTCLTGSMAASRP
ncbi:uncharacterized protein LOC100893700 [Strongylocentrotus purpuratus]|uniref:Uncharacterized protein n=1 Tax=Strongylocentrotus purpuratus TaxID=7668 RepID=A0A7M7PKJ8_STRPU|nr:uncharacterized protein LOC100893700 [Strongylocentrotus purpuratus]